MIAPRSDAPVFFGATGDPRVQAETPAEADHLVAGVPGGWRTPIEPRTA